MINITKKFNLINWVQEEHVIMEDKGFPIQVLMLDPCIPTIMKR